MARARATKAAGTSITSSQWRNTSREPAEARAGGRELTRGTHQVGAFAASLGALAFVLPVVGSSPFAHSLLGPLGLPVVAPPVNWQSLLGFLVAGLLGGTAPDLDKPRRWWARLLAHTAFGGHRHLSHSFIGLALATLAF